MKKIKLFALAVAAMLAGSAMAESTVTTGSYSKRTISEKGDSCVWNFVGIVTSETKINGLTKDNGLIFNAGTKDKLKIKSDQLSCNGGSSIYFHVPADSKGVITFFPTSTSDSRWFQLYIDTVAGNENQRLWSKEGDDLTKKGPRSYSFTSNDFTYVGDTAYLLFKDNNTELKCGSFQIVLTEGSYFGKPVPYPYVRSFKMGEIAAAIDTAAHTITAELPYGSIRNEEIKNAIIKMGGTAKTYSFNTDTTILTAIDSAEVAKNVDYALNITVNANPSDDATLKSLSVNGTAIKDFSADVLMYDYVVKFTETTMPTLSAEVNEAHAQKVINDVTEIPGAATVVVTAQDGTTQLTYTVNFTRATADKTLYEVVFSNGVKGAIFNVEDDYRIEVPYLAGAGEPTYVSDSVAEGATVEVEGDKLTVTGADATVIEYSIYFIELSAPEFTTDTITFDSTETYIYGHYGWDSSKGWKFAKAVNDEGNMRISTGKTRIYMALPACGKVTLISGSGGARAVKVSANGHTPASLTTGKANAGMDIYPSSSEVNFIAIESNQTGGDGGFIKMVMSNEGPATKLSDMKAGVKAEKFIMNGKVYFRHNGQVFNALGQEMK